MKTSLVTTMKARRALRARRLQLMGFLAVIITCTSALSAGRGRPPLARYMLDSQTLNFSEFISRNEGYVYLMFFNAAYVDFVKSWICNVRLFEENTVERTLFVASDQQSAAHLQSLDPAIFVHVSPALHEAQTYGTYGYFRLTLERLLIQNALLQAGINVFVIEPDAVWLSPVSSYLSNILVQNALVSANDRGPSKPLISAGFLYVKSTERDFFEHYVSRYSLLLSKYKNSKGSIDHVEPGEQHLMTRLLRKSRSNSVFWLDECLFARGEWYSDSSYRDACPHPLVIQNNYIRGIDSKVSRAQQWGHWFLSSDGECARPGFFKSSSPKFSKSRLKRNLSVSKLLGSGLLAEEGNLVQS